MINQKVTKVGRGIAWPYTRILYLDKKLSGWIEKRFSRNNQEESFIFSYDQTIFYKQNEKIKLFDVAPIFFWKILDFFNHSLSSFYAFDIYFKALD